MKRILDDPLSLVGGISDVDAKREMVTSLLARKYVAIDKKNASKSWWEAQNAARALVR